MRTKMRFARCAKVLQLLDNIRYLEKLPSQKANRKEPNVSYVVPYDGVIPPRPVFGSV